MSPGVKYLVFFCAAVLIEACMQSCAGPRVKREVTQVSAIKEFDGRGMYLKVHLTNGELYVLHTWSVNALTRVVTGYGNHLDHNRKILRSRGGTLDNAKSSAGERPKFSIPIDEVVVVETNDKGFNAAMPTLVLTHLITIPVSLICLLNPKGCFGSCPTFFIRTDTSEKLVAEGFSSSISRSLQETDVDLIDFPIDYDAEISLVVKNEALETHMIRRVDLLVCEKEPGNRVLRDVHNVFYEVADIRTPIRAQHESLSILKEIEKKDKLEWYSTSDSIDLKETEDIFLDFENPQTDIALVLEKRQSLMTTYLFYHTLALMGTSSAYYMSEMETRQGWMKKWVTKMYDRLGGVEVSVRDRSGRWQNICEVREAGPIVSDVHLIDLPDSDDKTVSVRLRMAKGLWRINRVGLATKVKESKPQLIQPQMVSRAEVVDTASHKRLVMNDSYLVTYPGDVLEIRYPVTASPSLEVFVESEGYYIEWMRQEWLADENHKAFRRVLLNPSGYLKKMAPHYKVQEPKMEEVFWNSRYTNLEE
jgi:hypothetical protein